MPFKVFLAMLGLISFNAHLADSGDDDDAGENDKPDDQDDNKPDNDDDDVLGTEGLEALKSERAARRLAESKARDLEKNAAELAEKLRIRDEEDAEKQGQWEKLAESRAKKIEELEEKIRSAETQKEREAILTKYKLTGEEAVNVHGETIEEYEKSAKLQAKLLGRNSGPDLGGGQGDPQKPPAPPKDSKLSNWKFK